MIKNVEITKFVKQGLYRSKKGFPKRFKLFGCDTETCNGEPLSLQIYDGNPDKEVFFAWVNKDNILDVFVQYIKDNIELKHPNIYYFHNLSFDMAVILYSKLKVFSEKAHLVCDYEDCHFDCLYGSTNFMKIRYNKTMIWVVDSLAFMGGGSLEKWAKTLNLSYKKMEHPEGLGDTDYSKLDDNDPLKKYFIEYAKTDVLTEYELGKWILEQHQKYDVSLAVSSANFSAKVFRKSYLPLDDNIPFPPNKCVRDCMLSYHGGRNGYYWNNPAVFNNCCELDISSSYPYAMVSIPNFVDCEYIWVDKYVDGLEGIYNIIGIFNSCKYPPFFKHDLKPFEDGEDFNVWITSYELREAIADGTLQKGKYKIVGGWLVKPSSRNPEDPFKNFVWEFYNKKEIKGLDKGERQMYKLILNSLYGKFIQTNLDEERVFKIATENPEQSLLSNIINERKDGSMEIINNFNDKHYFIAGGLFQPMIATLITGFGRAYLHRLEHKYKAIHSSTDSVKFNAERLSKEKFESYQRKLAGNKDKGVLGDVNVEVIGKCIILRNKLYLHYNQEGVIEKQAFHGFAGRTQELLQVLNSKNCDYTVKKILKVRESFRQGLKPLVMTELKKNLDVDLSKFEVVNNY